MFVSGIHYQCGTWRHFPSCITPLRLIFGHFATMHSPTTPHSDIQRVAVVGLGSAGTSLHLPALAGMPDVRVVAVVDPDQARCSQVATEYSVPGFAGIEDMLAATQSDIVVIATPPSMHASHCVLALQAGAHVMCEKPFVASLDEADQVMRVAEQSGRSVALNHEFRDMPIFRSLREHVAGSDVLFTQAWQLIDLPTSAEAGWRGHMGHRTLYEAGVHVLDLVMSVYGECPVAVTATISNAGTATNASDAVVAVTLEFSRGRIAQLVQNRLCKGERQYLELRVDTPEASWRASFGGRARISAGLHRSTAPHFRLEVGISGIAWKEEGPKRTILARNPKDPGMRATRAVLESTFRAFQTGALPPTSAALARDILAVTVASYASAESGRRIELNAKTLNELRSVRLGVDYSANANSK